MTKWKKVFWGIVTVTLFIIGLAGVPTNIMRWGKTLIFIAHYMNLEMSRVVMSVSGLLVIAVVFLFPYLKPRLDIELIPSAGTSTDVLLRILNRGGKREFHAQCTPIALRNSPNELYRGTFDLKWDHTFDRSISIGSGDSCNLLIAKVQNDHKNGLSEMEIVGLSGQETKRFEWSRWNTEPNEKLPEYDLEIIILSDGAKPISERFTLRPRAWYGPLEMFKFKPLFSS